MIGHRLGRIGGQRLGTLVGEVVKHVHGFDRFFALLLVAKNQVDPQM